MIFLVTLIKPINGIIHTSNWQIKATSHIYQSSILRQSEITKCSLPVWTAAKSNSIGTLNVSSKCLCLLKRPILVFSLCLIEATKILLLITLLSLEQIWAFVTALQQWSSHFLHPLRSPGTTCHDLAWLWRCVFWVVGWAEPTSQNTGVESGCCLLPHLFFISSHQESFLRSSRSTNLCQIVKPFTVVIRPGSCCVKSSVK